MTSSWSRTLLLGLTVFTLAWSPGCDGGEGEEGEGEEAGDHERTDGVLALEGDPRSGESVFTMVCGVSTCHGADGNTPGTAEAARLTDEVPELGDREIVNVVLNGYETMAAQSQLSDQQIADTLAYLRQTFGG